MSNVSEKNSAGCLVGQEKSAFFDASAADEKRTTLSLSLTVGDKKALKMLAAERETTVAAIVHEWIAEHCKKGVC